MVDTVRLSSFKESFSTLMGWDIQESPHVDLFSLGGCVLVEGATASLAKPGGGLTDAGALLLEDVVGRSVFLDSFRVCSLETGTVQPGVFCADVGSAQPLEAFPKRSSPIFSLHVALWVATIPPHERGKDRSSWRGPKQSSFFPLLFLGSRRKPGFIVRGRMEQEDEAVVPWSPTHDLLSRCVVMEWIIILVFVHPRRIRLKA